MADSMHYETRQIREALQASNARLRSARYARPASSLTPQQGAAMLQEWEGLSSTGDIDNVSAGGRCQKCGGFGQPPLRVSAACAPRPAR